MRTFNKIQLLSIMNAHLVAYPTPMNLNWAWNGGSLAGIMLGSQMLTGILLAMHYVGHVDYAFASVQHLMTDVPSGIILRYAHANGASLFFIVVYLHVLRGMYYGSGAQPREIVWISGVVILLVMIITAFIGYVLPWGQMSFWGATVITSLATAIPVVGKHIMYWLWGGFSVDNPTLNRFYSFHYTLPFVLAGLSVFHIAALHQYGSTNPLGINSQSSTLSFGPYFGPKDLLGALFLALAFSILVFFYPDLLGHPDNMIPANPYSTPQHIVPEWYVCWIYAILRSIPSKVGGVLAVGLVFASLIAMPFMGLHGGKFKPVTEVLFWALLADLCLLTWIGTQEITVVTSYVGQACTVFLFVYLLGVLPLVGYLESAFEQDVRGGLMERAVFTVLLLLAGLFVAYLVGDMWMNLSTGSALMFGVGIKKNFDSNPVKVYVATLTLNGWYGWVLYSKSQARDFMAALGAHNVLFTQGTQTSIEAYRDSLMVLNNGTDMKAFIAMMSKAYKVTNNLAAIRDLMRPYSQKLPENKLPLEF